MINNKKFEKLIFDEKDLRDLVIDKLIYPIGIFLQRNQDKFNGLITDEEIKKIKKFGKAEKNKNVPRIILLGYHPNTNMLHLLLINEKYGEKNSKLESKEITRGFIGLVTDYLDPANPLEVVLDPVIENKISKGLTQLSIKIRQRNNWILDPKIVFSYYAPLDARSRNSLYFDIPLNLEKTFYIPLYNGDLLNNEMLIGVLLVSFDYNDEINLNIKDEFKNNEYYKYLENFKSFISDHKKREEKLESQKWFVDFGSKFESNLESFANKIMRESEKKQRILEESCICKNLNEEKEIIDGKRVLKKLLFNRLFIYEEFLNFLDYYILYEFENLMNN